MDYHPWVLPIWTSVHCHAEKHGLLKATEEESQLGIDLSTRLRMLDVLVPRLMGDFNALKGEVSKRDRRCEYAPGRAGFALRADTLLVCNMLLSIDSFLFEVNAATDLIKSFLGRMYLRLREPRKSKELGPILRQVLERAECDLDWFEELDRARNLFAHKRAPYIALNIDDKGDVVDLLVMIENLNDFSDRSKFLTFEDLEKIRVGFLRGICAVRDHLIGLFDRGY